MSTQPNHTVADSTGPRSTWAGTLAEEPGPQPEPVVRLRDARLAYGPRVLWDGLDLDVRPGEFLAVLGPNGSGKTSLLQVLLGLQPLNTGNVEVAGAAPRRGSSEIGYIPQQRAVDETLTVRGTDLVGFGLDGHHWGLGVRHRRERARKVRDAVSAVEADSYASMPLGLLSGGEQQRLRVAQAIVSDPSVLLCDEPLLSLDPSHQRKVSSLIAEQAKSAGAGVLFVTHEINPVLPLVDRVLYLVDGKFRIGTPAEVMNSETLSALYGTRIDVARVGGRMVVAGGDEPAHPHHVHEGGR